MNLTDFCLCSSSLLLLFLGASCIFSAPLLTPCLGFSHNSYSEAVFKEYLTIIENTLKK